MPPKRSDYKEPSDSFVIELGSPAKGVTPKKTATELAAPNPADPAVRTLPDPASDTSTDEEGSEIHLESVENVSFCRGLFVEVQLRAWAGGGEKAL